MLRFLLVLCYAAVAAPLIGQPSPTKYTRSAPAMGTTFRLVFYAETPAEADQAAAAAFSKIEELNGIFSDYRQDSEISQLAANAGKKVRVSDHLWFLIRFSKKISKQSHGAFDVTVGPLTKLWRQAIRQVEFPDSAKLNSAKNLVNYRWIKLYPATRQVKLKKQGMKLDFGAIAKGYAIDQAYSVLQEHGITHALVDGGGDLFVGTVPKAGAPWEIKDHDGQPLQVPVNSGVASSGDSYRNLQWDGTRYSHIVDPEKGLGVENSSPVTVMASSATIADALASAVSVMTPEHSKRLLRKYRAKLLK